MLAVLIAVAASTGSYAFARSSSMPHLQLVQLCAGAGANPHVCLARPRSRRSAICCGWVAGSRPATRLHACRRRGSPEGRAVQCRVRPMRRIILVIVIAIAITLAGCGTTARPTTTTITRVTTTTSTSLAPSVSASVVTIIEASVERVEACAGAPTAKLGTAFNTTAGFVTDYHVVACGAGGITVGGANVVVAGGGPEHDLAVLSGGAAAPPLPLASAHVGERVTVVGINQQTSTFEPVQETVAAVGQTFTVSANEPSGLGTTYGISATFHDVIEMRPDAEHAIPGMSGSPVIDASGAVVGVLDAAGAIYDSATPAADIG